MKLKEMKLADGAERYNQGLKKRSKTLTTMRFRALMRTIKSPGRCSVMRRGTRAVDAFPDSKPRHECVMWTGAKWGTRDGELSRDFTYIENAVNRTLRAAEVPDDSGIVFNGRAGARITLNEVVHQLEEITGNKIAVHCEPPRHGDIRDSQADISLARQTLGQ